MRSLHKIQDNCCLSQTKYISGRRQGQDHAVNRFTFSLYDQKVEEYSDTAYSISNSRFLYVNIRHDTNVVFY